LIAISIMVSALSDTQSRVDHFPTANVKHRVDSLLEMGSLARAGLGVVVLGCFAGDSDPRLRRVYPQPITTNEMDLWVPWVQLPVAKP